MMVVLCPQQTMDNMHVREHELHAITALMKCQWIFMLVTKDACKEHIVNSYTCSIICKPLSDRQTFIHLNIAAAIYMNKLHLILK